MGRHKIPTALLNARGSFKKNPQRARNDEPIVAASLPLEPPKSLPEAFHDTWREIVSIIPEGVACFSDALHVEICVKLLFEYRQKGFAFDAARLGRLSAAFSKLGL